VVGGSAGGQATQCVAICQQLANIHYFTLRTHAIVWEESKQLSKRAFDIRA